MTDKRAVYRRRRILVALCLILPVVFGISILFMNQYSQYKALCAERDQIAAKLSNVQGEQETLKEEVLFTKTQDFIERMARELLGWVKPGEIKFVPTD